MTTSYAGVRGITLIEMFIVVLIIAIIAAIMIPMVTESRMTANETSAIASMKAIATAQAQYWEHDSEQDTFQDFATSLMELSQVSLLDNVLGSGLKSGYVFSVSGATFEWSATATPINDNAGKRAFFIDVQGIVRFETSGTPDADSPPIGQ